MASKGNTALLERIRELKADHPYWGYRRIWAYLKFHHGLPVNRKRIYRLMKEHQLLVIGKRELKATRGSSTRKPRTIEPNTYWGIDMTKIMIPTFGWVYVHVVLDRVIRNAHLDKRGALHYCIASLTVMNFYACINQFAFFRIQ